MAEGGAGGGTISEIPRPSSAPPVTRRKAPGFFGKFMLKSDSEMAMYAAGRGDRRLVTSSLLRILADPESSREFELGLSGLDKNRDQKAIDTIIWAAYTLFTRVEGQVGCAAGRLIAGNLWKASNETFGKMCTDATSWIAYRSEEKAMVGAEIAARMYTSLSVTDKGIAKEIRHEMDNKARHGRIEHIRAAAQHFFDKIAEAAI